MGTVTAPGHRRPPVMAAAVTTTDVLGPVPETVRGSRPLIAIKHPPLAAVATPTVNIVIV